MQVVLVKLVAQTEPEAAGALARPVIQMDKARGETAQLHQYLARQLPMRVAAEEAAAVLLAVAALGAAVEVLNTLGQPAMQ